MASSRKPKREMRATSATLAVSSSYAARPSGLLFVLRCTEIPDEVLDHPNMQCLVESFINIIMYDNVHHFLTIQTQEPNAYFPPQDILLYQKEDAADESHNMLTVYMHARKASLQ